MARDSERERGKHERARMSVRDRVMASDSEEEREGARGAVDGQKYRESAGGSERGRLMARNSEK